jgi:aspartyl protease family protein
VTDASSSPPPSAPPPPAAPPKRPHRRRSAVRGFLVFILALVALAMATNGLWNPSASPQDSRDMSQLGTLLLILLFAGSALLGRRLRAGEIVRGVIGWGLIALVVTTGYAYRGEIAAVGGRVLAAFAPGVPIAGRLAGETENASVVVVRGRSGQFAVRARVDDVPLTMLIDTGASFVTLTLKDAVGVGIDMRSLAFNLPIRTANGTIRAAAVTIDRLVVGTIVREHLSALVAPPDTLNESLLGMSFLETLAGYSISGDRLVLND